MKKIIIIFSSIVIVSLAIFFNWYTNTTKQKEEVQAFNNYFSTYIENEIRGVDLTTVINKAIDNNEHYEIKKSENGAYILDDEYSLEVLIKISKNDENYYLMEAFEKTGMENFTVLYGAESFKCIKKEFHSNGRISKLVFEICD